MLLYVEWTLDHLLNINIINILVGEKKKNTNYSMTFEKYLLCDLDIELTNGQPSNLNKIYYSRVNISSFEDKLLCGSQITYKTENSINLKCIICKEKKTLTIKLQNALENLDFTVIEEIKNYPKYIGGCDYNIFFEFIKLNKYCEIINDVGQHIKFKIFEYNESNAENNVF